MKQTFFILAFGMCAGVSNATVLTVNNNNPSPGQYSTFADAHANASMLDTIYVSGSPFSYGDFEVSIPLIIIGTGYNPSKENPFISKIDTLILDGFFALDASLSTISGLDINRVLTNRDHLFGITISRCRIHEGIEIGTSAFPDMNSWQIQDCFITAEFYEPVKILGLNHSISNNVIEDNRAGNFLPYFIDCSATEDVSFRHNIFINQYFQKSFDVSYGTVESNIFNGNFIFTGLGGNVFNNCLYGCSSDFCDIEFGLCACNFQNNLEDIDPLFVNYTGGAVDYDSDFHLQPNSPAKYTGTGGTEMGVYGGSGHFTMSGEPAIPQIRAFSIPSRVGSGGTLNGNGISTSDN